MHPRGTVPESATPFWSEGRIAKSPSRWPASQGGGPESSQPQSEVARLVGSTLNSGEVKSLPMCVMEGNSPSSA